MPKKKEINELEFDLTRIKIVKVKYPKLKLQHDGENYHFSDKSVINNFNNFNISEGWKQLDLQISDQIKFIYHGKEEIIDIFSIPNKIRIAYFNYIKVDEFNKSYYRDMLSFNKISRKIKNRISNEIDTAILAYIKK